MLSSNSSVLVATRQSSTYTIICSITPRSWEILESLRKENLYGYLQEWFLLLEGTSTLCGEALKALATLISYLQAIWPVNCASVWFQNDFFSFKRTSTDCFCCVLGLAAIKWMTNGDGVQLIEGTLRGLNTTLPQYAAKNGVSLQKTEKFGLSLITNRTKYIDILKTDPDSLKYAQLSTAITSVRFSSSFICYYVTLH